LISGIVAIVVFWRRVLSGVRAALHRAQLDRELDEELREYLRMATDQNVAAGMSPDEALRSARAQFGGMESVKERVRDVGWESIVDSLFQDVRYGIRVLSRNVGFTAVAVLALALGIGVNTAVFTAYKAMVGRPLDARNPREMVNVALARQSGATTFLFSYPDYEAYRDSVLSFSGLIAFSTEHMTLSNAGGIVSQRMSAAESLVGRLGLLSSGASNAEFASTFAVSENYFKVLGVTALRGRTFDSIGVSELAASPSALISENYWQKRFAGDPAVLGRMIHLNGAAVTIVGITPHDFVGTGVAVPDFWLPVSLEPLVHANDRWLLDRENERCRLFARLAPGVSMAEAQAEMTSITGQLRTLHDPHSESAKAATALVWPGSPFPLPLNQYGGLTLAIRLIMAAAAMVLVVACANVGSLQLARARSRQNELHTRLSLGASRGRVIRQLLTESALLGLLGGIAALLFTWGLLKIAVAQIADLLPVEYGTLIFDVTPDLGIFSYAFAMSLLAGVLFGLAPAIESSRSALSSAARAATSSVRSRRVQDMLVCAQVALSLVLLIAGGLLIRSSMHSLTMDPGYETAHIVDLDFQFSEAGKYTAGRKQAIVRQLRTRLATLPGVTAITSARPPDDNRFRTPAISLDGEPSSPRNVRTMLHYSYVEANYFETLRIPVFAGRVFQPQAAEAERSLILSQSAATQLWPGQNPIGRTVRLGITDERIHDWNELRADGPSYQVVGVVRDTRGVEFDGGDSKQAYLLLPDDPLENHPLLIRTASDTADVVRAIDPLIASIDPDLLGTTSTLEDMLRQSGPFIVSSLSAAVASTVGLLGLFLALMGIHGTVNYIVVLRTREVGIRMAIGAQRRDILGLILRESTRPVLVGLLMGMFLAVGASYVLRGLLYGLNPVDGISFIGISLLFLAIALLAAYAPSRRALRVDPMVALRYE
jgi:predicted permease